MTTELFIQIRSNSELDSMQYEWQLAMDLTTQTNQRSQVPNTEDLNTSMDTLSLHNNNNNSNNKKIAYLVPRVQQAGPTRQYSVTATN
jgi:hypothetical protein